MMKKYVLLAALTLIAGLAMTACGDNMDTEKPPYEDDVKDTNHNGNTNNSGTDKLEDDIKDGVDDLKNGVENIGDDIRDGIDDFGNGVQDGVDDIRDGMDNGMDRMDDAPRTSRLEDATQNLMKSVKNASDAIRQGIIKLTN